jgi:hypothetical protein
MFGFSSERAIATLQNLSAEVLADDFIKRAMIDNGTWGWLEWVRVG